MYDRLTETYINEADAQYNLADASYQQMALQQAQVVKQITDRVRSERMARLRAGMSESQIANQDMQMLMANVDALINSLCDATTEVRSTNESWTSSG